MVTRLAGQRWSGILTWSIIKWCKTHHLVVDFTRERQWRCSPYFTPTTHKIIQLSSSRILATICIIYFTF